MKSNDQPKRPWQYVDVGVRTNGHSAGYHVDSDLRSVVSSGHDGFDAIAAHTETLLNDRGGWHDPVAIVAAFYDATDVHGGTVVRWSVIGGPTRVPAASRIDPTKMTRAERLAEAQRRWAEWARTATTDDPPDNLYAEITLPEAYWRRLGKRERN